MIKFHCSNCKQKLGVSDEYAGRRVRCNKCNQPSVVPKPHAARSPLVRKASKEQALPKIDELPPPELEDIDRDGFLDFEGLEKAEDGPSLEVTQMDRQDQDAESTQAETSGEKTKKSSKGRHQRISITECVPDILRLPLSLGLSIAAVAVTISIWIACSRAAESALCFFAVFIPLAGALGLRMFVVERSFLVGLLGIAIGAAGIIGGKVAIAKHVVIPYYEQKASEEFLVDMDTLLADEKLQLERGQNTKPYTRDGDFMICIALFSLVDDGLADPIKVRAWALHILKASKKTNTIEYLTSLTMRSDMPRGPELDDEGKLVFRKAFRRQIEWYENKTELRNLRKYFPALARLTEQCKLQRIMENPRSAFKFALANTMGLFDLIWILMGLALGYFALVFD